MFANFRHARIHHPPKSIQVACTLLKHQSKDPVRPTLRANPFPKVTDLFCRIRLRTLLHGPTAAHLGDLMRLWVRAGVQLSLAFNFSRTMGSMLDTSEDRRLARQFTLAPCGPISGSETVKKKKRTLPNTLPCVTKIPYVATPYPRPGGVILAPFPLERRGKACASGSALSLRTNPCANAVHKEPSSTSDFTVPS